MYSEIEIKDVIISTQRKVIFYYLFSHRPLPKLKHVRMDIRGHRSSIPLLLIVVLLTHYLGKYPQVLLQIKRLVLLQQQYSSFFPQYTSDQIESFTNGCFYYPLIKFANCNGVVFQWVSMPESTKLLIFKNIFPIQICFGSVLGGESSSLTCTQQLKICSVFFSF